MNISPSELLNYYKMSWILLEYEVIYFISHNVYIDESWIKLRKISDETYDSKLEAFKNIALKVGKSYQRPVGCNIERAAVKLVLNKFKAPAFEFGRVPVIWPDEATETDEELSIRMYLETEYLIDLSDIV